MKLVIGGYAQGKLQTMVRTLSNAQYVVFDGELPKEEQLHSDAREKLIIINHLHLWVKEQMLQNKNPKEEILSFIEENKECIIICDEIGNGIVPLDAFEREYREHTGRILIELAGKADEVVRIICGIQQRIK